ncbi:MAG: hypothetical protein AAF495_06195 [Pseudomonadota bacterium]
MTPGRLILDDPAAPASGYRYAALGALAELFPAIGRPARRAVVPARPDPRYEVHDLQHVTASGQPTVNGVIWLERAGVSIEFDGTVSVPSLEIGSDGVLHGRVRWGEAGSFCVEFDRPPGAVAEFSLDCYGRPRLRRESGMTALLGPVRPDAEKVASASCKIAILADPHRTVWVYPAVRAALGDGADALDCRATIEVVPPPQDPRCWAEASMWQGYDGVVLTGGADMERTEALIAAADVCRRIDVPTLGLCLGMQAMCVAAARRLPYMQDASLEETTPEGKVLLFTRLPRSDGRTWRRLGDHEVTVNPGSSLARSLAGTGAAMGWAERMNHSYRLNPRYHSDLTESGLSIIAQDKASDVVDLIEDSKNTFYVGSEGHPELTSRRQAPNPLIQAFLWSVTQTHTVRQSS